MFMGTKFQADAHRPAQDAADAACLAQTVFYHADWAWNFAEATNPRLRRKGYELAVTWLPTNYFN